MLSNDLLLAVPFFTFMGAVLERCGLAEDMLDSMAQLFGTIKGGLGYSVIIVGFILRGDYRHRRGSGDRNGIDLDAGDDPLRLQHAVHDGGPGGIGNDHPAGPALAVLIVLAYQLGKPVGPMYLGAWGPSLVQIALFALYTFALTVFKPEWVPAAPRDIRTDTGWALWRRCLLGIIPSAVLIFVVLGTMMLGLATPTEAGAMGAIGAIVLAVVHHPELSRWGRRIFVVGLVAGSIGTVLGIFEAAPLAFKLAFAVTYFAVAWLCLEAVRIGDLRNLIKQGYETTMRITAMVIFILIGSTCFSVVFLGVDGNRWLEDMLSSLPGGVWGFLVFINLFIFFLAFFLDFFEIAFIILPMIAPIAQKMLTPVVGADAALIWFGVMLCVNMQTSFMHPPFGFALFYLRGVAPKEVKTSDIYWGALPWVGLQLIMVGLVIAFPIIVTGLLDSPSTIDPSQGAYRYSNTCIPRFRRHPANPDRPAGQQVKIRGARSAFQSQARHGKVTR